MEIKLLNKNHHGLFFSVHRFWKGVYIHLPFKSKTYTFRLFLFGFDWWHHNNRIHADRANRPASGECPTAPGQ
jgi:hypothetical protein